MIEEGGVVPKSTSPVPPVVTSPIVEKTTMSFPMAIQKVIDGKKITKLEWKNDKEYGFLSRTTLFLTIHREDKDHTWVVNEGDLVGKDWTVID